MQLIVEENYESMSKEAANIIIKEIKNKPDITLGLATGSTPMEMCNLLIKGYKNGLIDFSNVKCFNLDEYIGLDENHPSSYRYYMNKNLFDHINIDLKNTHLPNGKAEDLAKHVKEYDSLIRKKGGIDIQVLGIGTNGHIAFNEPAEKLCVGTSIVNLKENTIKDNSRFFDNPDEIPKTAITMGIGSILKAKKIILLASGKEKRKAIKELLKEDTLNPEIPASFLALHPDVTIILDKAAYPK